jgi:hypothetical protein
VHRNANAALSPTEFAALRRVAGGLINTVVSEHRIVLLGMELIQFDGLDGLSLTELGWLRLEREVPKTRRERRQSFRRTSPLVTHRLAPRPATSGVAATTTG